MSFKRSANTEVLEKALKSFPGKSMVEKAEAIGVSDGLLRGLLKNKYPFQVKDESRRKICSSLGLDEDEVFPLIAVKDNAS